MEAVFGRDDGSLFRSDPRPKPFYCPTTPVSTHQQTTPTVQSTCAPTKPQNTTPTRSLHWDMVVPVTMATTELINSSGSSKYNESWSSRSEVTMETPGRSSEGDVIISDCGGSTGGGVARGGILAKYVDRFRKAPPTDRISRETPSYSFWWKRDHVINLESHVTPPKAPQDHSTPESSTKAVSHTDPSFRVSPLVPPDPSSHEDSLDVRSQELINKSSSLLSTCSSTTSAPAQKYLNSRQPAQSRAQSQSGPQPIAPQLFLDSSSKLLPEAGPPDDILYQWRLKRRLEKARHEAAMATSEGWRCDPLSRRAEGQTQVQFDLPMRNDSGEGPLSPCCHGDPTSGKMYRRGEHCPCCSGCGLQQRQQTGMPVDGVKGQVRTNKSSAPPTTDVGSHSAHLHRTYSTPPHPHTEQLLPHNLESQPHTMESPLSQPHTTESLPSQPYTMESPPSQPHTTVSPPSQPHTMESPPSQPHTTESPPSQPHTTESPSSQPHTMESPPSQPHTMESLLHSAGPPPSQPHTRPVFESEPSDDVNMSDFSLDFTMETDHTHHTDQGRGTQEIRSVVTEVVSEHLFRARALPNTSTAHTPGPDTDIPLSTDESTSKRESGGNTVLPWDCHMEDQLLKCLIERAHLFEDQIKIVDCALAAMEGPTDSDQPSTHCS